jgi:hypothetical protein
MEIGTVMPDALRAVQRRVFPALLRRFLRYFGYIMNITLDAPAFLGYPSQAKRLCVITLAATCHCFAQPR